MAICREVGDRYEEAVALCGLGHAVAATRGPGTARAHLGMALASFESLQAPQADEIRGLLNGGTAPATST